MRSLNLAALAALADGAGLAPPPRNYAASWRPQPPSPEQVLKQKRIAKQRAKNRAARKQRRRSK
jgi:hypothetical protein